MEGFIPSVVMRAHVESRGHWLRCYSAILTVVLQLHAEPSSISARRNSRMPLEDFPEECHILVADCVTDFLHRSMTTLQQSLRGCHSQLLQINQWRVTGRLLKASNEISQTHAYLPCRILQWKCLTKVFVQPFLCAGYQVVRVVRLERHNGKSGLPHPWRFDQQCFRSLHRNFMSAESLHQIQAQIQRRVHPASAVE